MKWVHRGAKGVAGDVGTELEWHCRAGASIRFRLQWDEIAARALELLQLGITGTGVPAVASGLS